jgi:hypothetical protein
LRSENDLVPCAEWQFLYRENIYRKYFYGFYFSSGFQFRDIFFNLGNCRENLRKFFSLRTSPKGSENIISRPLWACPEERNIAQNFPIPKLKTRLSLTGFLKRHDPTKSRSHFYPQKFFSFTVKYFDRSEYLWTGWSKYFDN